MSIVGTTSEIFLFISCLFNRYRGLSICNDEELLTRSYLSCITNSFSPMFAHVPRWSVKT